MCIRDSYDKIDEYDKYALDIDTQVKAAAAQLDMYVNCLLYTSRCV